MSDKISSMNSLNSDDYENLKRLVTHNKTVINNTIKENEKIIEHYEKAINKIKNQNKRLTMEHAKIERVLSTLHKKKQTRKIGITSKSKTPKNAYRLPGTRFVIEDYNPTPSGDDGIPLKESDFGSLGESKY